MRDINTLEEFWPYYLSQHSVRACRVMHVVGTVGATVLGVTAAASGSWLVVLAPVFGLSMAWTGHFIFERNRPASWHSPKHLFWSFLCDLRLAAHAITGTIEPELARAASMYPEAER